ncbi:MAG: hypothetical protein M1823_001720 [Watsoniomyces obsoletus]|nr:MAG: hypothetical protein M1823_001720 [Watsoniomyces obsoletus]
MAARNTRSGRGLQREAEIQEVWDKYNANELFKDLLDGTVHRSELEQMNQDIEDVNKRHNWNGPTVKIRGQIPWMQYKQQLDMWRHNLREIADGTVDPEEKEQDANKAFQETYSNIAKLNEERQVPERWNIDLNTLGQWCADNIQNSSKKPPPTAGETFIKSGLARTPPIESITYDASTPTPIMQGASNNKPAAGSRIQEKQGSPLSQGPASGLWQTPGTSTTAPGSGRRMVDNERSDHDTEVNERLWETPGGFEPEQSSRKLPEETSEPPQQNRQKRTPARTSDLGTKDNERLGETSESVQPVQSSRKTPTAPLRSTNKRTPDHGGDTSKSPDHLEDAGETLSDDESDGEVGITPEDAQKAVAKEYGIHMQCEVVACRRVGPHGFQCLVRYGDEKAPGYRLEPGASQTFDEEQIIHLKDQSVGKQRVGDTFEYQYKAKDIKTYEGVAWRVHDEHLHDPLAAIAPAAKKSYPTTFVLVRWNNLQEPTWESRTVMRRLLKGSHLKVDTLIHSLAKRQEKRFARRTGTSPDKIGVVSKEMVKKSKRAQQGELALQRVLAKYPEMAGSVRNATPVEATPKRNAQGKARSRVGERSKSVKVRDSPTHRRTPASRRRRGLPTPSQSVEGTSEEEDDEDEEDDDEER